MIQNLKILLAGLFLTMGAAAPASANCGSCNDDVEFKDCFDIYAATAEQFVKCAAQQHTRRAAKKCEDDLGKGLAEAESKCTKMKKK